VIAPDGRGVDPHRFRTAASCAPTRNDEGEEEADDLTYVRTNNTRAPARRISLRPSEGRNGQQHGHARGRMQKLSMGKFHARFRKTTDLVSAEGAPQNGMSV